MPEVHIVGQLHSGAYFTKDTAATFCRWRIVAGPGWTVLDGAQAGQTQAAEVDRTGEFSGDDGGSAVWAHPLDVHFGCTTLTGWPQLCCTVWSQDTLSRNEIVGYGVVRIPPSPGVHALELPTWRPMGSAAQELAAYFLGGLPHLADTSMLLDPSERHRIGTVSSAVLSVELQVLVKGVEEHGVSLLQA